MEKIVSTLILSTVYTFFFAVSQVNGQCRLGSSWQEIIEEFKDDCNIEKKSFNSGNYYLMINCPNMERTTAYFFEKNSNYSNCKACAIFWHDQGSLNNMVEHHNKTAVIISDTEWKLYHKNGKISNIKLDFDKNCFIITSIN